MLRMIEYVAGFCFSQDLKGILLIQKKKPAWQAGRLNAIGGKIESDETPLVAMHREFKEETLWEPTGSTWINFATLIGSDFRVHFFCMQSHSYRWHMEKILQIQQSGAKPEEEKIHCNSVEYILSRNEFEIIPNLAWLIPMALNSLRNVESCKNFTILEN